MRNLKFVGMMVALLGFMVACGDSPAVQGEDTGSVRVVVANALTSGNAPDDVAEVEVVLTNAAHTYQERQAAPFSYSFPRVYTGEYEVSAIAWNASNEAIFVSEPTTVVVTKGSNQTIMIVMNQQGSSGEDTIPQFLSITLPTLVEQGDDALVVVEATGGAGSLMLSGRFSNSTPVAERGTFSGSETERTFVNGTAQITWTAPVVKPTAGYAWFILTITDDNGDQSEMGVTLFVGDDYGSDLTPELHWNLAPVVDVETRVLNDGDATTVYLWLTATDDADSTLDYEWSSTCNAAFIAAPAGPSGGAASSGELDAGVQTYFKAEVLDSDRDAGSCTLTATVADFDGATTVHSVHFATSLVLPELPGN